MNARVIDLRSRTAYASNPVRATRERLGMSHREFAAVLSRQLRWTAKPGMVKAWEDDVDWPDDVADACRALGSAGELASGEPIITYDDDAAAMRAFRASDLRHGGGYLYPLVLRYLTDKVAPRLFTDTGPAVFTTAAALSDMAGWMAHDAGHDKRAQDHFARAWQLASVSSDRQVTAHVLASNGHLAHHMGDAAEAIRASHAGLAALAGGPRAPGLEARLYAIEARGFAALREPAEAARRLTLAERALEATYDEPMSEWVSMCDEGTLAGEAARCLRQLGEISAAQRQAERVIELRPTTRPRSRALGLFVRAHALLAKGEPDEAVQVATGILDATGALGSYVIVRQFIDLGRALAPYKSRVAVCEFLARLEPALRDRVALHRSFPDGPAVVGLR